MNKVSVLDEIIKSRRSIFPPMYTGEKVEDKVIRHLLENANYAPTHKYTEPWRWHVITGTGLERMSEYCSKWYEKNMKGDRYSVLKHKKIKANLLSASHIIAICMRRDPIKSIPEWEEEAAVACAVQNMWLTATALGLGTYWSSPRYALEANDFLGLKVGEKCLGFFYVGVPSQHEFKPTQRKSYSSKTTWHR